MSNISNGILRKGRQPGCSAFNAFMAANLNQSPDTHMQKKTAES